MTNLSISIIIPTYNRDQLICRAVDSALIASNATDEIIVVDDGSTDNTQSVLSKYGNLISYIRIANSGVSAARNRGVQAAQNPLLCFLDSDDEWMPDKLLLQREIMQSKPDVLFCFSNFTVRFPSGENYPGYLANWHNKPYSWENLMGEAGTRFSSIAPLPEGRSDFSFFTGDLYLHQLSGNYVSTLTVMVRRAEAGSSLTFPEDISIWEDWECFSKISRIGKAAYLDCDTAYNHAHSGSRLTDTFADSLYIISNKIKVLERIWGTDNDFLAKYEDQYVEVLSDLRVQKTKKLISDSRIAEARSELKGMIKYPLSL